MFFDSNFSFNPGLFGSLTIFKFTMLATKTSVSIAGLRGLESTASGILLKFCDIQFLGHFFDVSYLLSFFLYFSSAGDSQYILIIPLSLCGYIVPHIWLYLTIYKAFSHLVLRIDMLHTEYFSPSQKYTLLSKQSEELTKDIWPDF